MEKHKIKTIIDLTLGDGSIRLHRKKAVFCACHSIKQTKYVEYKANILEKLGYRIHQNTYISSSKNSLGKEYHWLTSQSSNDMKNVYHIMYHNRKKILNNDIISYFDEKTLAILFMDDGCAHTKKQIKNNKLYIWTKGYQISTNNFAWDEVRLLTDWLQSKFSIKATISSQNGLPVLYIGNKDGRDKFKRIVEPFIIESMFYKIKHPHSQKEAIKTNSII